MSVSPNRLDRVSLIDRLAAELERQIVAGEYPNGARLPGESTLSLQFGVSRPVVRESLSRLRARGYVNTVNGRGTFARLPSSDDLSESLLQLIRTASPGGYSVEHLYEARTAIEALAVRAAAERADEEDLRELRSLLRDMKQYRNDPSAYTTADVSFHLALAHATKNPFIGALLAPLAKVIVEGVFTSSHQSDEAVNLGIKGHSVILRHVERRDPERAAAAMIAHLADSQLVFPHEALPTTDSPPDGRSTSARHPTQSQTIR